MTIKELEARLEDVFLSQEGHHQNIRDYVGFYNHSARYPRKNRARQNVTVPVNLLKAFGDKNIDHTVGLPTIKIPLTGSSPLARESADMREKIVMSTWQLSGFEMLHRRMARDATLKASAILEIAFDLKKRCVKVNRYDPKYSWWQMADTANNEILDFFYAVPTTKEKIKRIYGKDVSDGGLDPYQYATDDIRVDGKEYVMHIKWRTATHSAEWAGDTWLVKPHKHNLGEMPVKIAIPIEDDEQHGVGDFFLRPLVGLQADLTESFYRRANIVRKLGNPAIWGRGIVKNQFADIKAALNGEGGFIGLKANGELGVLSVPETAMIDKQIEDTLNFMMKISGFGAASFGESVGANTSGDALGMYFTPTTRRIENQRIAWTSFYKEANAMILRTWEKFLKTDETRTLDGYLPRGAFQGVSDEDTKRPQYDSQGFSVVFDKSVIGGQYASKIEWEEVAPKDEIAFKRLIIEAVNHGVLSKDTGQELWGIESPADEMRKLEAETSNPSLNPSGNAQLLQGVASLNSSEQQQQAQATVPPPDQQAV